jgi:outer membrane protein assembly factor BamB
LIIHESDGVLAAVELRDGSTPAVLWRFPTDADDIDFDGIYAQPILDGDRLYIAGYAGLVVALENLKATPDEVWSAPLDLEANIVGTPVLEGSLLYIATDEGEVVTVDADTGAVLGRLPIADSRLWSAAVLDQGVLYVAGLDEPGLTALDAGPNVSLRWERDTTGAVRSDLAMLGELLIVGTFDGVLYAYDVDAQGAERWQFTGDGGWFFAPTLIAGDRIYAVTMRGSVYTLDRAGGELWSQEFEDAEFRVKPIIAESVLIVADRNGLLTGLDLTDGRTVWSQELENAQFDATPLVVGSKVIYVTTRGEIVSVDPVTGAIRRFELGG